MATKKRGRSSAYDDDTAYKGYLIRVSRISNYIWIEKGGYRIGGGYDSVSDAKKVIDLLGDVSDPTRKENPLYKGYSPDVIGRNISEALSKGVPHAQAIGIALTTARREYRAKHPTGPFPRHLKMLGKRMKNPVIGKEIDTINSVVKLMRKESASYAGMKDILGDITTDNDDSRRKSAALRGYANVLQAMPVIKKINKNPVSEKTAHKLRKVAPKTFQYMTDEEIKKAVKVKTKKKSARKNPVRVLKNKKRDPTYWVITLHNGYLSFRSDSGYTGTQPYNILEGGTAHQKAMSFIKQFKVKRGQYEIIDGENPVRPLKRGKNPVSTLIKVFKHGPGEKKFQKVGYFTGTGWDTSVSKAEKYSAGAARQLAAQLKIPAGWGLALVTG